MPPLALLVVAFATLVTAHVTLALGAATRGPRCGTAWAFLVALVVVGVWLATGPLFHFSDTWQLVINTGTTIVTFLMVFVIQNTQNRHAKGLHLKLDELIRAHRSARNELIELERFTDRELDELEEEFRRVREGQPPQ